ncbi:MAG: TolC family protein [Deltaproteobacteria bacterium]|nr:TolC family protein [Deltaproteobacteria bacterium]
MRARSRNSLWMLAILVPLIAQALPAYPASDPPSSREISIRQCVEIALRNNIDIAVAAAEKEIGEAGVPIEEAAFLPRFTGDLETNRSVIPSGSALNGALSLDQRVLKFDLGARDLLRTGTALTLAFENQRTETSSSVSLLSPEYRTALTLSAQQPLLKNFGRQVTEAPLMVARAGAAARTEEWKSKVMDIVAAARVAFLAFYSAGREVEVRRAALDLAERLLVQTNARIGAGAMAPMDRLPAEAAVAARKEELLRAETAAQDAADDLKNILGIRSAPEWDEPLLPAPMTGDIPPPSPGETYEEALRRRPEFPAQAARQAQTDIQEAAARNRTLPSLDLSLSAGLSGLSGTPNPNPLFPSSAAAFQGSYRDSLDQTFSGRYYNWFVGLSTEIPWRFNREKAEWARARSAAEEQRLLGEGLSSRVRMEVRKGRRNLESALARIDASRASAAAAAKKLEAEERKLELGRSTLYQVLQYQQDLADARLAEARAQADAYTAQTRLWRAVGTILDREGIALR